MTELNETLSYVCLDVVKYIINIFLDKHTVYRRS